MSGADKNDDKGPALLRHHPADQIWLPIEDGPWGYRCYIDWADGWLVSAVSYPSSEFQPLVYVPDAAAWARRLLTQSPTDLTPVLAALSNLQQGMTQMSGTVNSIDAAIAELQADVAAAQAGEDALITLVQGIPAAITAAVAAATAAGATPAQLASFDTLHAAITAETSKAVAAMPAPVTPPVTPPAPPVTPPAGP